MPVIASRHVVSHNIFKEYVLLILLSATENINPKKKNERRIWDFVERRAVPLKMMKLGEELPKISRVCVNNTNPLPSLYNNPCSEREIINKAKK